MATPLTDAINALTAYANEVTGSTTDQTLSDAVYTLAQGFGGIMNDLLEVVSSATVSEAIDTIDFDFPVNSEGQYIIVSDPPGTSAVAQEHTEVTQIMSMVSMAFYGINTFVFRTGITINMRTNPTSTTAIDWWSPAVTINTGSITVQLVNGRTQFKFLPNFTYYLLKVKGT